MRGIVSHNSPSANSDIPDIDIGQRLRALRTESGLSIKALAEQSGLNVNTLSLIENGRTSPSVSTLQQIAHALRVPISAFFETPTPPQTVVYTRADQRTNVAFAHGTLADLGAGLARRSIEPLIMTLEPNSGSGAQAIVHTGVEFVYCLTGRILYTIEDRPYLLSPGDSLTFEARLPHCWQNVEPALSQALLVLCPADVRDQPSALHFVPRHIDGR